MLALLKGNCAQMGRFVYSIIAYPLQTLISGVPDNLDYGSL